jgi:hypothetical protein
MACWLTEKLVLLAEAVTRYTYKTQEVQEGWEFGRVGFIAAHVFILG